MNPRILTEIAELRANIEAHPERDWRQAAKAQLPNLFALADEVAKLRERVAELSERVSWLDCRFAGDFAELSSSHCPLGRPCVRCETEAEHAVEVANLRGALTESQRAFIQALGIVTRERDEARTALESERASAGGGAQ